MIKGIIMLADDTNVFEAYFVHPPRAGEYLWRAAGSSDEIRAQHGTTSFLVKEVAHWCLPDYAPDAGQDAIHKLAIYVEPTKREPGI